MIRTVSDILTRMIEKEKAAIAKYPDLNHGPMIGDMYEGLTKKVLGLTIFEELDIRVVEGKILNDGGELSRQIDCMIVEGEGENLPNTDHYIYPMKQVIAVVEVKKTMYRQEVTDAYDHLLDLKDRIYEPKNICADLVQNAWRGIMQRTFPKREDLDRLPITEQQIFHTLCVEASLPIRIVLGYYGYATEGRLRRGFYDFLQAQLTNSGGSPKRGFGFISFPTIILCKNSALFKLNGMPFAVPYEEGWWPCMGSVGTNPILILLELLWTRLSYYYKVSPSIFGEDLDREGVNPFLSARVAEQDDTPGWQYKMHELSAADLTAGNARVPWEPADLTCAEWVIVQMMCEGVVPDLADPELLAFLEGKKTDVHELCNSLREKRLAFEEDGKLYLLTEKCQVAFLPNGRCIAAENISGRLTRYVASYMKESSEM